MSSDFEDEFTEEITETGAEGSDVTLDDFVAYLPTHSYIFTPCCTIWGAAGVNARLAPIPIGTKNGKTITISASRWLDENRSVESTTWCPGQPPLIPDRLVIDGGWIERQGVKSFNFYRPPRIKLGDAAKAAPWINHAHKVFDAADADHIIKWLAQRVQRPDEKINHALVLGSGAQGIGKDTLLEPVKHAVGPWNFQEITPAALLGRFNSFAKAVILRVSEARDLGEINRFGFYDHTKIYTAAPPDTLRVDQKHMQEYHVFNCLGLIITTNHKTDGIFLPPDDRRHYVAWSDRAKEDFPHGYWDEIWGWYRANGGLGHVAAYLAGLDISDFDAKAPPPKTAAWRQIVTAGSAPEDAELADALDSLGNPDAIATKQLIAAATGELAEWITDRRNRRSITHRMERCKYSAITNKDADDGLWRIGGTRQRVYARSALSEKDKLAAVVKLINAKT